MQIAYSECITNRESPKQMTPEQLLASTLHTVTESQRMTPISGKLNGRIVPVVRAHVWFDCGHDYVWHGWKIGDDVPRLNEQHHCATCLDAILATVKATD